MTKIVPADKTTMSPPGSLLQVYFIWSCFLVGFFYLCVLSRVFKFNIIDIFFYTDSFCSNIII